MGSHISAKNGNSRPSLLARQEKGIFSDIPQPISHDSCSLTLSWFSHFTERIKASSYECHQLIFPCSFWVSLSLPCFHVECVSSYPPVFWFFPDSLSLAMPVLQVTRARHLGLTIDPSRDLHMQLPVGLSLPGITFIPSLLPLVSLAEVIGGSWNSVDYVPWI